MKNDMNKNLVKDQMILPLDVPSFKCWWKTWSSEHLTSHPLKNVLDELVHSTSAAGAQRMCCNMLGEHVNSRVCSNSAELLFGDLSALRERNDFCWWLYYDGMIGPSLGAAIADDGTVLMVWIVIEG